MNESSIFGISIRAYIVFMMVTAFVIMNFMKIEIDETFSTLVISLISFYFGNKTSPTPDPPPIIKSSTVILQPSSPEEKNEKITVT
jgi:hypothetical protein